jgi:hypothetical protein
MKITITGPQSIKFIPDTQHECECLDALWKLIIRCDADSKVLCPVGRYIAGQDDGAHFVIEDRRLGAE